MTAFIIPDATFFVNIFSDKKQVFSDNPKSVLTNRPFYDINEGYIPSFRFFACSVIFTVLTVFI